MERIVSGRSLRYRRMGSATLKSKTPTGSIARKHRMVETYCDNINLVSAPGCSSRRLFLKYRKLSD